MCSPTERSAIRGGGTCRTRHPQRLPRAAGTGLGVVFVVTFVQTSGVRRWGGSAVWSRRSSALRRRNRRAGAWSLLTLKCSASSVLVASFAHSSKSRHCSANTCALFGRRAQLQRVALAAAQDALRRGLLSVPCLPPIVVDDGKSAAEDEHRCIDSNL